MFTNMYVLYLEENLGNSIFLYYYHVGPSSQTDINKLDSTSSCTLQTLSSHKIKWTEWYLYTYFLSYHSVHFFSHLSFALCNVII